MNPAFRSLMWYLLVGTRGGPNRQRVLDELRRSPANAHQLSSTLGLDYRTVRHHLKLLEGNGAVVRSVPNAYAPPYELSPYLAEHYEAVRAVIAEAERLRAHHGHSRPRPALPRAARGVP